SKPGNDAATGGNPGNNADGSKLSTASARSLPAFTCGIVSTTSRNMVCASLASMPTKAVALPLYGTRTMLTPAIALNNSAAKKDAPPGLAVAAMLSAPGFALAKAISSFTLFAGSDDCTTSTCVLVFTKVTGAKSRNASYDVFCTSGVIQVVLPAMAMV